MSFFCRSLLPLFALAFALPSLAATTTLQLHPSEAGAPYNAEYSQGISVKAQLTDSDGNPVVGERVTFQFAQADDATTQFTIGDPVTDAQGIATTRLTFVNGRYGGKDFPTDFNEPGFPYTLRAIFLGEGGALGCDGTPVEDDTTLCESEDEGELFLKPEVTELTIQGGIEVALGETVTLIAQLSDPNGDAPEAGTDLDGSDVRFIEGGRVSFFYDVDGNGRPSLDELLGEGLTNSEGVATFDFNADPSFAQAANIDDGIHAQYGGDDFYSLAGASQDALILVGEVVAANTILQLFVEGEAPVDVIANGATQIEIRATLVDGFNNIYSEDSEGQIVDFSASAGVLLETAERDPIDGTYFQFLRAPLEEGTVTFSTTVNGVEGPSETLTFLPRPGCACSSTQTPLPFLLMPALALLAFLRKRGRHTKEQA